MEWKKARSRDAFFFFKLRHELNDQRRQSSTFRTSAAHVEYKKALSITSQSKTSTVPE